MLTFISCAKTMASHADVPVPYRTEPVYLAEAENTAKVLAGYPATDLIDMMHTSPAIAAEVKEMFGAIIRDEAERLPAILAYTGAVFKRINPRNFSSDDFSYAQRHLRITSFLYGQEMQLLLQDMIPGRTHLHAFGTQSVLDFLQYEFLHIPFSNLCLFFKLRQDVILQYERIRCKCRIFHILALLLFP